MKLSFRPHHFLCTLGFEGKGYSPKFVKNYTAIVEALQTNEDLPIEVTSHLDAICSACPHNSQHVCETEQQIQTLDERHAEVLELLPGDVLTWTEAKDRIRRKMTLVRFHKVCQGCPWKSLGVCERALKSHRGEL